MSGSGGPEYAQEASLGVDVAGCRAGGAEDVDEGISGPAAGFQRQCQTGTGGDGLRVPGEKITEDLDGSAGSWTSSARRRRLGPVW